MSELRHKQGDLFRYNCDVIAHVTNCSNGFGSGFAKTISTKYPKVKKLFHKKFKTEGTSLGEIQICYPHSVKIEDLGGFCPIYIVNMYAQAQYGYDGKRYIDYDALRVCLKQTFDFCESSSYSLSIPRIGSGLAGGDPALIESIIKEELQGRSFSCTMFTF